MDTCPICSAPISPTENFCPQCGAKLREAPLSISLTRQIVIYCISFFLAPFGLGYAFKYLRMKDPKARQIGIVVLILTAIAVGIMFWASSAFTRYETQSLNSLNSF